MTKFKATLATLKKVRDSEAHTHIKRATKHVNAPSVTIGQFLPVYEGLLEYDRAIKASKFSGDRAI